VGYILVSVVVVVVVEMRFQPVVTSLFLRVVWSHSEKKDLRFRPQDKTQLKAISVLQEL